MRVAVDERDERGRTHGDHPGGGSSQVYNVIDSRDRNERGEAKLCRGISTIIRIISPELGGRVGRANKASVRIRIPSVYICSHSKRCTPAPTCDCFPAKRG